MKSVKQCPKVRKQVNFKEKFGVLIVHSSMDVPFGRRVGRGGGWGGLTLVLLPGNETDPCQSAPQDDVIIIIEKKTILFFKAKEIFLYRHSLPENGV
jgi:hypothetical protein